MNLFTEYRIGDLLVKKQGKQVILMISEIKTYDSGIECILIDMADSTARAYFEEHVRSWHFYKHYPVRI